MNEENLHIDPWDPGNYPEPGITVEQAWTAMDRLLDQQKPDSGFRSWPLLFLLLPLWIIFRKYTGIFLLVGILGGMVFWCMGEQAEMKEKAGVKHKREVENEVKFKVDWVANRVDAGELKGPAGDHVEGNQQWLYKEEPDSGRSMKRVVEESISEKKNNLKRIRKIKDSENGSPVLEPSDGLPNGMIPKINSVARNKRSVVKLAQGSESKDAGSNKIPFIELGSAPAGMNPNLLSSPGIKLNQDSPLSRNTLRPVRLSDEMFLTEIAGAISLSGNEKEQRLFTLKQANGPAIEQEMLNRLPGAKKKRNNNTGKGFSFGLAVKPAIPFRGSGAYFSKFDSGRQVLPLLSPAVWVSRSVGKKGELMLELNPFQAYHTGEQEIYSFKGPGPSPDTGSVNTIVSLQKAWGYGLSFSYRHSIGKRWGFSGGIQYNRISKALVRESVFRISTGDLLSNKLTGIRKDTSLWKELNPAFLQARLELWYRLGRFETGAALQIPFSPHLGNKPRVLQGELIIRWRFRK